MTCMLRGVLGLYISHSPSGSIPVWMPPDRWSLAPSSNMRKTGSNNRPVGAARAQANPGAVQLKGQHIGKQTRAYKYKGLGGRHCFGQRTLPQEHTLTATVPAHHAHKFKRQFSEAALLRPTHPPQGAYVNRDSANSLNESA